MRFVHVSEPEAAVRLDQSTYGLQQRFPDLAASPLLSRGQRRALIAFVVVVGVASLFQVRNTVIALISVTTFFYVATTLNRVLLFVRSRRPGTQYVISDDEAHAVPDSELPSYTILVPAYDEPGIIERLVNNLEQLDYPRNLLDIKVVLEADDDATISAIRNVEVGAHVSVVLVPPSEPRTKPKALNYALGLSTGEIITIYDAEDQPEPLQLRRAAIALRNANDDVACVQAKLSYSNVEQNLITRWFTIEYAMWFSLFLPGLVQLGAPLPLGGTSNHFRRDVLEELGAWDPHNVTEDADLGTRMARQGYRCGVLDSVTLEEANSDFINWVKQRSRWYKGYLQTFLIHIRHPLVARRQLGTLGLVEFVLFVGGTPALSVLNPIFWLSTLTWFFVHPHLLIALYPSPLFYVATASWIFGNFLVAYLTVLTCRLTGRPTLVVAAILVPIYWVMMALAAIKAVLQLIITPNFWEKTTHGLDRRETGATATAPVTDVGLGPFPAGR